MWFSKNNKQTRQSKRQTQQTTQHLLASMLSNGVQLGIDELIQYQSKSSLINLAASKSLHGKMSGNYLARSKGRGMEFDEVRHYQNGDDIRAIDWRVTARTGKTHTKIFREEIERPVLIATDLSASMLFGSQLLFKSIQASHLAALVAWHAKSRGDRVGGIVFNQISHSELKPRSRQQGVLHYLHALSQSHQQSLFAHLNIGQDIPKVHFRESNKESTNAAATNDLKITQCKRDFEQNCARIRQLARPGSLVYLITDANHLTQEAIRHLSHVSRHCELVVCIISDPLEHQLPDSKNKINVAVTDGEKRQQLTLGDQKTARDYSLQTRLLAQQKEHLLAKAGARVLNFSAGQSLETQLKNGALAWIR